MKDRLNDLAALKLRLQRLPQEHPLTEAKINFFAEVNSINPMTKVFNDGEKPGSTSIASYESVNYSLKMVAETLGIENKEFMVFSATPVSVRLSQMRNSIQLIVEFMNEQRNEIEVF